MLKLFLTSWRVPPAVRTENDSLSSRPFDHSTAFCLTQTEVRDRAALIFRGKYPQFDRLEKTFDTAGIDKR
jgi:hypothetical protein